MNPWSRTIRPLLSPTPIQSSTANGELQTANPGSHFAGGRNWLLDAFLGTMWSGNDQDDGGEDDYGSNNRAQRDDFVGHEPPEKQRHHRIDQRIGGHARGSALLEHIQVRREANARPDYHQVSQRNPRAPRDGGEMEAVKFAGDQTGEEQNDASGKALH